MNRMHALNGAAKRVLCIVLRFAYHTKKPPFPPFFLCFFTFMLIYLSDTRNKKDLFYTLLLFESAGVGVEGAWLESVRRGQGVG